MARSTNPAGLRRGLGLVVGVGLAAGLLLHGAERRISLEELNSRRLPDYAVRLADETVVVRGVVSAPAFHFSDYNVLAIENDQFGGVIKVPAQDNWLDRFHPGDEIEAAGKIVVQYGMPMVAPS